MRQPPCLPSDDDLELLQAALAPPSQARAAWQRWREQNREGPGHHTHNRMLPLIARRLSPESLDEADRLFLRGLYRYHWTRNQLLSNCAAAILGTLQQAGIDTLLLKGLALAHLTYQDLGVRPMHDFDVLVRPAQRDQAVAVLEQAGWTYTAPMPALSADHGCEFRNAADQRFDLHWFATDESRWPGADDDLWENSRPLQIGAAGTLALSPGHQLMHVLIHGVKVTGANPCIWVADACAILDSESKIEWSKFLASVRRRRVVLPLKLGLEYLKNQLGRPVPPELIADLRATPVNWTDRLYYHTKIQGGETKLALLRPYLDYRRTENNRSFLGFLNFLRLRWHLRQIRQIPGRVWRGLCNRFSPEP